MKSNQNPRGENRRYQFGLRTEIRDVLSPLISKVCGFKSSTPEMRRRQWHPTPVLLPGKSHGWRSLVSPWGH